MKLYVIHSKSKEANFQFIHGEFKDHTLNITKRQSSRRYHQEFTVYVSAQLKLPNIEL
jgi:hypothetical protein